MGTVSSLVKEYVDQNNAAATRTALTTIGYIADYKSFENFMASTEYAKEKLPNIFQEDDQQQYETSNNVEDYKKIIKMMMSNFSEEKYNSAVKIGMAIFEKSSEEKEHSITESHDTEAESASFFSKIMRIVKEIPIAMKNLFRWMIQEPKRLLATVGAIIVVIAILIGRLK